jgi:hypothetical protein
MLTSEWVEAEISDSSPAVQTHWSRQTKWLTHPQRSATASLWPCRPGEYDKKQLCVQIESNESLRVRQARRPMQRAQQG